MKRSRLVGKLISLAATLPLALALGTSGIGVVYALWTERVELRGVAHTGNLAAAWTGVGCQEFHGWPRVPPVAPLGEVGGRDVAATTSEISADGRLLTLTLSNAYPDYAVICATRLTNTGSVPWAVRGIRISPQANLTGCIQSGNSSRRVMRCRQLTVIFGNSVGVRVKPNDSEAGSVRIHVEDRAAENATYSFRIDECVAQWNERVTGAQCFAAAP